MSRIYDAPRSLVWEAMTEARHVAKWWGGAGVKNPVCEMNVRPGGHWHHVMQFPSGHEIQMEFIFLEVDAPETLSWRSVLDTQPGGPPASTITVTLTDLGEQTAWKMVA